MVQQANVSQVSHTSTDKAEAGTSFQQKSRFTSGEAGEGYPLVGEGDDVRQLADEVGGKLGPLDGGLHLATNLPLPGQTLRQVLKQNSSHYPNLISCCDKSLNVMKCWHG